MPKKFIRISDNFFAAPQIDENDVAEAAAEGFTLIVNNRPDGEGLGQPTSASIEAAARDAGLAYLYAPVGPAGISADLVDRLRDALEAPGAKVVGFCKSGMRSAAFHAFAEAFAGRPVDDILEDARAAGFTLDAQRAALEAAARQ